MGVEVFLEIEHGQAGSAEQREAAHHDLDGHGGLLESVDDQHRPDDVHEPGDGDQVLLPGEPGGSRLPGALEAPVLTHVGGYEKLLVH